MKIHYESHPTRNSLTRLALIGALGLCLGVGNARAAAPANDNFANAIELVGDSGTQTGTNNVDATFEAGEPICGPSADYAATTNSVWFKWVCTQSGSFSLSTTGSTTAVPAEWDAVVCVYTGSSLATLSQVKAQDTGLDESLSLAVSPGTYYIQLGGFSPPSPGDVATNILLNWSFALPTLVDISNANGPLIDGGMKIDAVVGPSSTGRLVGYVSTYWASQGFTVPLQLNGNTLEVNSGGGNEPFGAHGPISGAGSLILDTVLSHRITVDAANSSDLS